MSCLQPCTSTGINLCLDVTRPLKGLGNIVKIRENGAKVVNSMLDVQLKITLHVEG